jgi:hypothetical protein
MDALSRIAIDYQNDRTRFDMIVDGIERAVRGSFGLATEIKHSEVKRRTDICARWFCTLRYDLGWSTMRCADELASCLRCELSGVDYVPATGDSWFADGSADRDRIILLG